MFLVARFFRGVSGENQAFFDFLEAVMLFVKVEGSGEAVGLIEVPDVRLGAELVQQAGATRAEDDVLGDAAKVVLIIEPVGDGPRESVIFLYIGAEEKHRDRVENISGEEHRLDPDIMAVDGNGEADAGVLEEGVFLFTKLHGQLAILAAGLIVVAVSPKDADAAEVLLKGGSGLHVGASEEAEAAGVNFKTLIDSELA